jgi:hypothetical protein
MSQAHIEQFYSKAVKDPALVHKMLGGTNGPDDFIRNAVKEGKSQGYDFSYEEADGWIKEQQRMKASGELSDAQLEGVAGGKGAAMQNLSNSMTNNIYTQDANAVGTWATGAAHTVSSGVTSAANTVASGATSAYHAVSNFFSSW